MKKSSLFSALVFGVFIIFISSFVSAYYLSELRQVSQNVVNFYVDIFEPVLQVLLGGTGWNGLYLFERFLMFLIFFGIVFVTVGNVELLSQNKAVKWIISLSVSIIGIRFMNFEWLDALFVQYSLAALVLGSVLPFIIFFYFVYGVSGEHGVMRKLAWGLFCLVYFGLWTNATSDASSLIYFWTIIAGFVLLFGDNIIHRRYIALQEIRRNRMFINTEVTNINERIKQLNESIANETTPNPGITRQQIRELEKHKIWLLKQ